MKLDDEGGNEMIKSAFFRIPSLLFAAFAITVGFGAITHADAVQSVPADKNSASSPQSGNHFSPVYFSERLLMNEMNKQRQAASLPVLGADWDLFRFARLSAENLASGRIRQIDESKIARMLSHLGRSYGKIRALVIRAPIKAQFPQSFWRSSDKAEQLIKKDTMKRVGVGYAAGEEGQIWVVLFSEAGD